MSNLLDELKFTARLLACGTLMLLWVSVMVAAIGAGIPWLMS